MIRHHGKTPVLSIVCPTVNCTSERFQGLARSLHEHTLVPFEFIVIDAYGAPRGFVEPINRGIWLAQGDYVCTINDDVTVTQGWWEALQLVLDNGASVVYPMTRGFDRNDLNGWCWAFKAQDYQELAADPEGGHFHHPGFIFWYSDTEMVARLTEKGRPPVKVPESVIDHGLSQTLDNKSDPTTSRWLWQQTRKDEEQFRRLMQERTAPQRRTRLEPSSSSAPTPRATAPSVAQH